jgi:uncharacterized delta-60 repeat protein
MRKLFCYLILSLFFASTAFAVTEAWVARYASPGNTEDYVAKMTADSSGNVYVAGYMPYPGIAYDYTIVKYNSNGAQQWVATYNGPGNSNDIPSAIAVDSLGNVYVTGYSGGSGTSADYATVKYNSAGAEQWVARYNGPGNSGDSANAIAVDSLGNVYVTGKGYNSTNDYATVKYNSAGVEQWVAIYDVSIDDTAYAIAVDSSGNAYVTGYSVGVGTNTDYATIKYNSAGVEQWVTRYDGPASGEDRALSIAVDSSGNVYATGWSKSTPSWASTDYATVKYDSAGVQQWAVRYNGTANNDDQAKVIAVDSLGNVYVTGYSTGSGTSDDYLTIKYNSAGVEQWAARYNGPIDSSDDALAIALDPSGNVYVTGYSFGSGTSYDCATIKYNSAGVEQWVARYNGPGNGGDVGQSIALDSSGNVYVAGNSAGVGTGPDFVAIKYTQAPPDTESPSISAVTPNTVLNNTIVQFNITAADNVAVTGCTFYWDGASNGSMTNVGGDIWAFNHTISEASSHYAWANCTDGTNTNKTNTTMTVNTLPYSYSQDYDGSADPAAYAATFGGNETSGYDWANAVKLHVPAFAHGWIFLNLSIPAGVTEATLAVFKYNGTNTTQMTAGAYGEAGKYNVTDNRIYINVTASDPDFGGVGPVIAPGGGEPSGVAAAPESPLAALAVIGAALIIGAFLIARRR